MKADLRLNMGKIGVLTLVITSLLNISCNSEGIPSQDEQGNDAKEAKLVAEAKSKDFMETRSSLTLGSRGMDFKWTAEDELTVFAKGDDQSTNLYKLKSGTGTTSATFSADYFSLKKDVRYYALSMSEHNACDGTKIPDQRNITLSYAGQIQKGNASTAHLGQYDYMVASTICDADNNAHFSFTHLGLTLRLVMNTESSDAEAFRNTEFTEIEIYDSEDSFRQPQRFYSFEAGTSADNSKFSVVWPEQTITSAERFKLNLQNATDNTKGIKPTEDTNDGSGSSNNKLIAYIELPPNDFTGKMIGFIVRGKNGTSDVTYYGSSQGFSMLNDKAYQINLTLKQTTDYTVILKVNHQWQNGYTEDNSAKTRATGDPGYDDKVYLPTNLYYVFCVGGNVRKVNNADYNCIKNIPVADWTTTADEVLSTYKTKLTLQTTDEDKGKSKHLYVVASTKDLEDGCFKNNTLNTEEEVRALVFDIDGASASCTALDETQTFLRDIYSTPWDTEATFSGNLKNPIQDVILYHTAAKVDLKWNSTNALPTTGDNNTVKVKNVKDTNLFLFKPTENTYDSGSYTYTVSAPITIGTQWNGRQVFYLPQFANPNCSYDVTIGSNPHTGANEVKFSPSTANGFTSWLRWLKTY